MSDLFPTGQNRPEYHPRSGLFAISDRTWTKRESKYLISKKRTLDDVDRVLAKLEDRLTRMNNELDDIILQEFETRKSSALTVADAIVVRDYVSPYTKKRGWYLGSPFRGRITPPYMSKPSADRARHLICDVHMTLLRRKREVHNIEKILCFEHVVDREWHPGKRLEVTLIKTAKRTRVCGFSLDVAADMSVCDSALEITYIDRVVEVG